jgi:glycogen synthase
VDWIHLAQDRKEWRDLVNTVISVDVFWDVAACSLVVIYRHLRGAYCFHYHPDDGGSKLL